MASKGKFVDGYNMLQDGRRVWIIQANDDPTKSKEGWRWDEMLGDKPSLSSWGGTKWVKSYPSKKRIREEFGNGDIAFCYQAEPEKKFVGVARIAGRDDNEEGAFLLDWWMPAHGPAHSDYEADEILGQSEKALASVGTILRLSPREAKRLYSMYHLTHRQKAVVEKALALPPEISKTGPGLAPRAPERQPVDLEPPDRVETTVTRVVRDTEIARRAKAAAGHACAICGVQIVRGDGNPYSEAHHLQPLAKAHKGPDVSDNIVVLCPTHHAEFDFGSIAIHPKTHEVRHIDPKNRFHKKKPHKLSPQTGAKFIKYHWDKVFGGPKT